MINDAALRTFSSIFSSSSSFICICICNCVFCWVFQLHCNATHRRAVPADAEAEPPLPSCRIVATFRLTFLIEFVMPLVLLNLLPSLPSHAIFTASPKYFRVALKVFNSSLANHKLGHNSNHTAPSISLSLSLCLALPKLFSNLQDKLRSFFASVSTFGQLLFVLRPLIEGGAGLQGVVGVQRSCHKLCPPCWPLSHSCVHKCP